MSEAERITEFYVRDVDLPVGRVALITMDNGCREPTTFGPGSLARLAQALDGLVARVDELAAVALTGKPGYPGMFAAGADLKQAAGLTKLPSAARTDRAGLTRLGHEQFQRFAHLPVPTFALINGLALGGGLEIALHATYRSACTSVRAIGLPEVSLGLVPAWGGCFLLPHLIGPAAAARVIVENPLRPGRLLTAADALALGLVDVTFEPVDFLESSLAWVSRVVAGQAPRRAVIDLSAAQWQAALAPAEAVVAAKTGGHAPAALRALSLIADAHTSGRAAAFAAEDQAGADLLATPEFRASWYAFNLLRTGRKGPPTMPDGRLVGALARPVHRIGIVGAGLMAAQLAVLCAWRAQVPVILADLDQQRVDLGLGSVARQVTDLMARGKICADQGHRIRGLISGTTALTDLADVDFAVEAVFEELSLKQEIFARLEKIVSSTCVFASNTSSLSLTQMAAGLTHPHRLLGCHFFNPVAVMPLLEIGLTSATDESSVATACELGRTLQKTLVLVRDRPAFVVNRVLGRMLSDVTRLVDQGTAFAVAEGAFAGLVPMPPYRLADLVGPTIALRNAESLAAAFPDRFWVSPNLRAVVDANLPGFYRDGELDPRVVVGWHHPARPIARTAEEVRQHVLAGLADEVERMLAEGVTATAADLDLALLTGAGFTPWNGGLTPLLTRLGLLASSA